MAIEILKTDTFDQWRQKTNQLAVDVAGTAGVGDLQFLQTADKSNVVAAVNELVNVKENKSALGTVAYVNSVPVSMGGTGLTTAGTLGNVLTSTGTGWISKSIEIATGTVTSVSFSGGTTGLTSSGSPVTSSGTITLGGVLNVANGGTGATNAANARTNLGIGSVATENILTTVKGGTGLTTAGTLGNVLTSTGTGWISKSIDAVTSVGVSGGSTGLSVTGSPVTSSGTITLGGTLNATNGGTGRTALTSGHVLTGGGTGAVNLVAPGNAGNVLTSTGSGWISQQSTGGGGSGSVTSVGFSTGSTGLSISGSPITTSGTFTLGGTLSVANGGTGTTALTSGHVLTGGGTGPINPVAPGNAGNVLTSTGSGWISQQSTGGGGSGSVTSVGFSTGSTGLSVTGSPITTSGTFTLGGTLSVANGGTGGTTALAARQALGIGSAGTVNTVPVSMGGTGRSSLTSGYYLVGDGTSPVALKPFDQVASDIGLTNGTQSLYLKSLGVGTSGPLGTGVIYAGSVYAVSDITAYYSDDRLKTRIGNIENALDKINSLNGFYFKANQTAQNLGYEEKMEVGVSAQEVQKVLPEVVVPAPIDDKYLTVKYERLVPLLIESIKELSAELNELKRSLGREV